MTCQNIMLTMVRSPGFEPGSSAWQADVLAKLDYDRSNDRLRILRYHLLKSVMFLWGILALFLG